MVIQTVTAEPGGRQPLLKWKPLILSTQRIETLYQRYRSIPLVFRAEWRRPEAFFQYFNTPTSIFYEIGELEGIGSAIGIIPGLTAVVDFVMFDRSLKGREYTFHEILDEIFNVTKAVRLTGMVPASKYVVKRLFLRLGFKLEGKMRSAYRGYKGFEDLSILGILKDEMDHWTSPIDYRVEAVKPIGDSVLPTTQFNGEIHSRDMDTELEGNLSNQTSGNRNTGGDNAISEEES